MSPDGESIVTGAGDETLRFWKVFPKNQMEKVVHVIHIIAQSSLCMISLHNSFI